MVSVTKLQEILSNDCETITSLLQMAGFANITINNKRNECRFSYEVDSNPTSTVLDIITLKYHSFSRNKSGNIFSLVMDKLNMTFPATLKWISKVTGIENVTDEKIYTKLPFGGFFKELIRYRETPKELALTKYDLEILKPYENKLNTLFFKDGISYQSQRFFNIGYDCVSNRITIPEFDVNGNLVGIMGRLNKKSEEITEDELRWYPLIPCSRGYLLYGYHLNYKYISESNICFIGESEKFVMQLHSMGIHTGLGLGTCNISDVQAQYIKQTRAEKIILCFDEGLNEEQSIEMCKKIKSNNLLYTNQVGYVYDRDNILLPKGSKSSPTDYGYNVFKKLIKNNVLWIE